MRPPEVRRYRGAHYAGRPKALPQNFNGMTPINGNKT
ncbi:hypothetical protein BJ987_003521 [Nocardia goodfellowii]|uniref:Uncharacterized protein n=1 Tax=Nocardia goodfellowii TaxID=882446 RepID=A0ABS4QFZ8_9NOCA|nr:hypothetical protein [Nocardia goodfellowii]